MNETIQKLDVLHSLKRYEACLHVSIPLCSSISDNQEEAYRYTILAMIGLERFDEALHWVQQALGDFPNEPYFFYLKAFTLFSANRYKEALFEITTLLGIEPNNASYHHLHAQILTSLSLYVKAKRAIDKALLIDSHHVDYLCTLALITYHLGNTPIACEIIDSALMQEPNHSFALYLKSAIGTSSLDTQGRILKNLLFQNPFDKSTQEGYERIRRYYTLVPVIMLAFILYALGASLEMWEKGEEIGMALLIFSTYAWRDWRLSLPFFALIFTLLSETSLAQWYIIPIAALLYYFIGRVTGQIGMMLLATLQKMIHKGQKWLNP
ncbi:MAG: tetratricopeptide repeat protein [Sulfurospirillaceae bacterium]|jgi:tetratricopeptide (TPR) repeat protein|nr:tetratricopeptide repeat protein [Sulfurospirillaceae bacterium]MDD2825584.1 tetratricopeptide repeat protein [Sulfurospirillaceae bacterium]